MTNSTISRRRMLKGLGVTMSLPWLEAMGPLNAWSDQPVDGKPDKAVPNRMAFLYVPNGKNMVDWTPVKEGAGYDLPAILKPLSKVQKKLQVLTGLTAD